MNTKDDSTKVDVMRALVKQGSSLLALLVIPAAIALHYSYKQGTVSLDEVQVAAQFIIVQLLFAIFLRMD